MSISVSEELSGNTEGEHIDLNFQCSKANQRACERTADNLLLVEAVSHRFQNLWCLVAYSLRCSVAFCKYLSSRSSLKRSTDSPGLEELKSKHLQDSPALMDYAWMIATIKNEARLKLFYCSGEPETTQNYKFIDMNVPVIIKLVSGYIGLGMFLTEPATPGQLLLVSNAEVTCACVHDSAPYAADSYIHSPKAAFVARYPRIPSEAHQHLVSNLIKLLSTADEDLRERIFNLNTQISCNISETNDPLQSEFFHFRGESDVERVEQQLWNIIFKNAFCDKVRRLDPNKPSRVESFEMWGLWLLPSYINHSCSPNCHRMRVGDAVFIRAATDIAAGEELTLPYFDIFEPLHFRNATCELLGFRCDCSRCTFERSIGKPYDGISDTILNAMAELQAIWTAPQDTDEDRSHWLLRQLDVLQDPISLLEEKVTSDRKNKRTSSAQHETESNSCPKFSDLEDIQDYWIGASFMDIHIASFSLALTKSCRLGDSLLSQGGRSAGAEEIAWEIGRSSTIAKVADKIIKVIYKVHPGNVLGQEILLMWLKGSKTIARVAECAFTEDSAACINDIVQHLEHIIIPQFFQHYYGFPGDEALKLLAATES